ncbi:cytochrome b5-like [Rhododendron vialii]|uniref:cytochrome b5-like n=1 Tax=Rhododendron vialii TaxID=182163 RepID=UPI00265E0136|nr:cytochrome b5-like [Rhododendron vialii]
MASDSKLLALEEVNKHNKTKDCWLIISGKWEILLLGMLISRSTVYCYHSQPGGDVVLLSATGKDATNDFEDVGHSDSAREMIEKYYIGEVDHLQPVDLLFMVRFHGFYLFQSLVSGWGLSSCFGPLGSSI